MGRMVRKQLYIDAATDRALSARADVTGETQAEIVREALGRYLDDAGKSTQETAADSLLRLLEDTRRSGRFTMGGPVPSKEDLHEREPWRPDR